MRQKDDEAVVEQSKCGGVRMDFNLCGGQMFKESGRMTPSMNVDNTIENAVD